MKLYRVISESNRDSDGYPEVDMWLCESCLDEFSAESDDCSVMDSKVCKYSEDCCDQCGTNPDDE